MNIFIYAGSFDPVTNGHIDIIQRSRKLCDKLIVAVGVNEGKKPAFSTEEKIELIRASLKDQDGIEITCFKGLLTDFARKVGAKTIIKGLRAMSDFEFEFQMAMMNKHLAADIETLFMMTNVDYSYVSSSGVKAVAKAGGDISGLVPECIKDKIMERLGG